MRTRARSMLHGLTAFALTATITPITLAPPPGGGNGNGNGNGGGGGGGGGGGEDPPADPAIVYIDSRKGDLMVMDLDGSNQTKLLSRLGAVRLSMAPDGSFIVFGAEIDGTIGVWMINTDGTDFHLVIEVLDPGFGGAFATAVSPAPAPDGNYKIAYRDEEDNTGDWDVYLVNLDGTGWQQLTDTPGRVERDLTWSQDATRMAVTTIGQAEGVIVYDLGLAADGSIEVIGEIDVVFDFASPLAGANFHGLVDWANTDPNLLVLTASFPDDNDDIWTIDLLDPANPTQWTSDFNDERFPSFSADDALIIFQRAAFGTGDKDGIVVMDAAGAMTDLNQHGISPDA